MNPLIRATVFFGNLSTNRIERGVYKDFIFLLQRLFGGLSSESGCRIVHQQYILRAEITHVRNLRGDSSGAPQSDSVYKFCWVQNVVSNQAA